MMNWLVGLWAVCASGLFVASFFSPAAATLAPLGRYLYMVVLFVVLSGVLIALALRLLRTQQSNR